MGPYSHYILAAKLEHQLQPEHPEDYYWGTVIPDIRYLAHMRRDQTHLGRERLQKMAVCNPHLKSFLLGYQVHCLIDKIDICSLINKAFPFNVLKRVLRKNFSHQQTTMMLEMFYLQSLVPAHRLAGNHNEILEDLGITPEQTNVYFQAMQVYIDSHSFDAAISAFQKIGIIENARIEMYLDVNRAMKNRKILKPIFMLSVKNARLEQYVFSEVTKSGLK